MVWAFISRPRRHFPCFPLLLHSISLVLNANISGILLSLGQYTPSFSGSEEGLGEVISNSAKETPYLDNHVHQTGKLTT